MILREFAADFLEHIGDLVRFDREQQHAGKFHCSKI